MEKVLELISKEVGNAFEAAGYDRELGKVTISNRPDLCEYQCNGAMAGAKKYGKAPFMIADDVAARLAGNEMFEKVESVKPGFLNIVVSGDFARSYIDAHSAFEFLRDYCDCSLDGYVDNFGDYYDDDSAIVKEALEIVDGADSVDDLDISDLA